MFTTLAISIASFFAGILVDRLGITRYFLSFLKK